jgi:hypothetical protein
VFWTGAPYPGYCWLAFERVRSRRAHLVFAGTAVSAALATVMYLADLMPFVKAQSTGEEVMNCAGPLIEFGLPILQWLFLGFLCVVSSPRWSRPLYG